MPELLKHSLFEDANLENYYRLENLKDHSSKGRTLTQNGTVTFPEAKFSNGASATFNGTNNLVATSITPGTGAVSFGCWFKKSSPPTVDYSPTILNFGDGNRLYLFASKTQGYACFGTYDGTATDTISSVPVCDDVWHHLMCVRNGTTHIMYVDGVAVATVTGTARNANGTTIRIGNVDNANDYIGAAIVDETCVFSRALTAAEVLDLYQNSFTNYLTNYRGRKRTPGAVSV